MTHFYSTSHRTPLTMPITKTNRAIYGAECLIESEAQNQANHTFKHEREIAWQFSYERRKLMSQFHANCRADVNGLMDLYRENIISQETYTILIRRYWGDNA